MDDIEREANIEATKAKYGDNHWWESDHFYTRAYYQIKEPILLLKFSQFHEDIEALLDRPVWTHEFGLNMDSLREEAEKAWQGLERTKEDKDKAIAQGMKKLIGLGKETIFIEVE